MLQNLEMQIELNRLRQLNLDKPSGPGRLSHLSSASGLVKVGENFIVVADDELSLGLFPLESEKAGTLLQVFPGELPSEHKPRKKQKPDLEAVFMMKGFKTPEDKVLICIPSGSKSHRSRGCVVEITESGELNSAAKECDFSALFAVLEQSLPDLNIEGAVVRSETLLLFQRGNSSLIHNAVIQIDLQAFKKDLRTSKIGPSCLVGIRFYDLGELSGVPLSFTDAAITSSDQILFLAAAEATDNTFDDGDFRGAVLGALNSDLALKTILPLNVSAKPEGLWIETKGQTQIGYVVTDADDASIASELFSFVVPEKLFT